MAARVPFVTTVIDKNGNVIQNARVVLSETGTDTLVTDAYAAASGGAPQSAFVSDADGQIKAWFVDAKFIRTRTTDNGHTAFYPLVPGVPLTFEDLVLDDVPVAGDPKASDDYLTGTWDEMQATSALIPGQYFRATDQGLTYRSDGAIWVYSYGREGELYWTSYGALPNSDANVGSTTNAARNLAAWQALRADALSAVHGRPKAIVPWTMAGGEWPINTSDALDFSSLNVEGVAGGIIFGSLFQTDTHPQINNYGSGPAAKIADDIGGSSVRRLTLQGGNQGLSITNSALVNVEDVETLCVYDNTNQDNAAIFIRSAFWLRFRNWTARVYGASIPTGNSWDRGPTAVLMAAVTGEVIRGIGETHFEHGILDTGCFRWENRLVGGQGNTDVTIDDCTSENQGTQAFLQIATMDVADSVGVCNMQLVSCERADANAYAAHNAFITVQSNTGGTLRTGLVGSVRFCAPYTNFLVGCGPQADVVGFSTDTVGNASGIVFDPAREPVSGGFACFQLPGGQLSSRPMVYHVGDHGTPTLALSNGDFFGVKNASGTGEQYGSWGAVYGGYEIAGPGVNADFDITYGRAGVGFGAWPVKIKAGALADSDFPTLLRKDGIWGINKTSGKVEYRDGGTWHSTT